MEDKQQPSPNCVTIGHGWRDDGTPGICFMLPAAAFIEVDGGDPRPGIVMTPAQAREYALVLLLQAEQLASGSVVLPPRPGQN